ncbi:MAG: Maf family protein [Thermoguttaceae bacterium]
MQTIILASTSPRRAALLREAGYNVRVVPPRADAEDERRPNESPTKMVTRLAEQKARSITLPVADNTAHNTIVVGCDTVVVLSDGETILGKPKDRADAQLMLRKLQGTTQNVVSGLALRFPRDDSVRASTAVTQLGMMQLTNSEIDDYLNTGLWEGKAGGFGYQDRHGWLTVVAGSESNIVGMPLELLDEMLRHVSVTDTCIRG